MEKITNQESSESMRKDKAQEATNCDCLASVRGREWGKDGTLSLSLSLAIMYHFSIFTRPYEVTQTDTTAQNYNTDSLSDRYRAQVKWWTQEFCNDLCSHLPPPSHTHR